MNKIKWYLKQLFPLTYVTQIGIDKIEKVVIWKMWMGRSYNIKEWEVR